MCVSCGGLLCDTVSVRRSVDNLESVLSVYKVGPKACQRAPFYLSFFPKPLIFGNLIDSVTFCDVMTQCCRLQEGWGHHVTELPASPEKGNQL